MKLKVKIDFMNCSKMAWKGKKQKNNTKTRPKRQDQRVVIASYLRISASVLQRVG
jgi:hypothetical protein